MSDAMRRSSLGISIVLAGALLLTQAGLRAAVHGADKELTLLKASGFKGFVAAIKTNQVAPLSIPSKKLCDAIVFPKKQKLMQQAREFGLALLRETAALKVVPAGKELNAVDNALAIRSWSLAKQSYGNLILASVAEDTAVTLLFRSLADPKSDFEEIRSRAEACFRDGPTSAYWLHMLEKEKQPLNIVDVVPVTEADYLKLETIFKTLFKQQSEDDPSAVDMAFGGDYLACFSGYNPAHVGFLNITLSMRKSALAACLAVKEKLGSLPENRKEFRAALKQNAAAIMRKEDRLGSRIDSGQVWIIWQDALAKQPLE